MNWNEIIPETDLKVYAAAGYGAKATLGKRPALLVIDTTYDFTGDQPDEPILDSIAKFPNSCGPDGWKAVRTIAKLLVHFRERELPVFYTKGPDFNEVERMGNWLDKNSKMGNPPEISKQIGQKIVKEIEPIPGEIVITKDKPSAFFGTDLTSYLIKKGVDTVFMTGGTTSGCVRASVIDAFSYSFKVGVVTDGVFDRGVLSQQVNLFDMESKYANLMTGDEVADYLKTLSN